MEEFSRTDHYSVKKFDRYKKVISNYLQGTRDLAQLSVTVFDFDESGFGSQKIKPLPENEIQNIDRDFPIGTNIQ